MRKCFYVAALAVAVSSNASAGVVNGVPTGWKLESYGTSGVVIWNTPSTCANGQIVLPSTATVTDHNRLYATVVAAKASSIPIFIFYEMRDNACIVVSYGFE